MMPLDPRALRIDTYIAGTTHMKIWHEPSGCMVEGTMKKDEGQIALRKRLLEELSKKIFLG